jgi:peptidoglycan/xylan/chitin deacetylase (PgdA/CDA1 family)
MLSPDRQVSRHRRWQELGELGERYKPLLLDGVAALLDRLKATAPSRFARDALTAITFHRVLPADRLRLYPIPGLAVTPEQLEAILGELNQHFTCMPLVDAFRSWRSGGTPGRAPLGITFDDGALDNFEHARPVLDRLSLKASFYIPVRNVEEQRAPWHDRLGFALLSSVASLRKRPDLDFDGLLSPFGHSAASFAAVLPAEAVRLAAQGVVAAKRLSPEQRNLRLEALESALGGDQVPAWAGLMSWEQIRELGRAGHEIGSHSMTHPLLPDLSDAQIHEEVATSRSRLSELTGAEVASFCYPNGSYDARCLSAVRDAGYACAVTTRWGLNRTGSPYELKRCDMDYARLQSRRGEFSRERLFLRLSGLSPGLRRSGRV